MYAVESIPFTSVAYATGRELKASLLFSNGMSVDITAYSNSGYAVRVTASNGTSNGISRYSEEELSLLLTHIKSL